MRFRLYVLKFSSSVEFLAAEAAALKLRLIGASVILEVVLHLEAVDRGITVVDVLLDLDDFAVLIQNLYVEAEGLQLPHREVMDRTLISGMGMPSASIRGRAWRIRSVVTSRQQARW